MTLIQKIKLLFSANKPVTELIGELKEARRGWKTIGFWVTLLGTIGTLVAAVKSLIPATTALVAITIVTALYNILRGVQKADTDTNRGVVITTEFWLAIIGEISKAIVALQAGGINPAWMTTLSSIVAAAMAAAQQLAAQPKSGTDAPPAA